MRVNKRDISHFVSFLSFLSYLEQPKEQVVLLPLLTLTHSMCICSCPVFSVYFSFCINTFPPVNDNCQDAATVWLWSLHVHTLCVRAIGM